MFELASMAMLLHVQPHIKYVPRVQSFIHLMSSCSSDVLRLSILVKEIKTWKGYESTTSFVAFHLSPYVYMVDYSYPYTHA